MNASLFAVFIRIRIKQAGLLYILADMTLVTVHFTPAPLRQLMPSFIRC